jgi:MFS family permease
VLATLRQRNFALLWFGGLISMTGDWVLYAALPFYVYQTTGSTLATAILVACELLPHLLFGTVAGVFVDRWDRRRIMVVANVLQTAVVLLLLLVQSGEWLWVVYVVTFVQTTIVTFFGPAENALLPNLVGAEHLIAANSLNSLNNNVARLVGPAVGGVVLGLFGLYGVIVIDSASFLVAALMIALITAQPRPTPHDPVDATTPVPRGNRWAKFLAEWLDGLRLVKRERTIAILFFVFVLMSFGGVMFDPLYPPFVEDVLRAGPEGFGWLLTVQAVGGLIGGIIVGRFGNALPAVALLGWGSIVMGLLLFVQFNVPVYALALSIAFVMGIPSAANRVASQTMFQRNVPDTHRGRVSGALGTTTALLSLVSVLGLAGTLGDIVGIVPMLNVASGITLVSGVVALVLLPGADAKSRSAEITRASDEETPALG